MTDQQPPAPGPGEPTPGPPPPPAFGQQPPAGPPSAPAPPPPSGPSYPAYPAPGEAPPPQQPMPAYAGVPPQASKTLAIIALVLAIVGCVFITALAAIIVAIIALTQVRSGRAGGKGLAIGAIVISVLWLIAIGALIAVGLSISVERNDAGEITKGGKLPVTELRQGDCITKDTDKETVFTADVAPCDEPHLFEVYAVEELPGDDFPGKDEAIELSEQACTAAQADFDSSSTDQLSSSFIYPTEDSWDEAQDAICLVGTGKKVTGSLESE